MLIMKSSTLAFTWKITSRSFSLSSGIISLTKVKREKLLQRQLFERDICRSADDYRNWKSYVKSRDWDSVNNFWKRMVQTTDQTTLPSYIKGRVDSLQPITLDRAAIAYDSFQYDKTDSFTPKVTTDYAITNSFGVTNLRPVHKAGCFREFHVNSTRYNRDITLALSIGYVGDNFYGYSYQKDALGVENAVRNILKKEVKSLKAQTFGCGRTDRGVHAISQVVTFSVDQYNKNQLTKELLFQRFKDSEYYCKSEKGGNEEGKSLVLYDCYRVPRRFHARSTTLWRRYMYLFPLKQSEKPSMEEEKDEASDDLDEDSEPDTVVSDVSGPTSVPLLSLEEATFNIEYLNRILSQ
jgi:tRNA U38,U39,U40 pseudouridine synthase TruA